MEKAYGKEQLLTMSMWETGKRIGQKVMELTHGLMVLHVIYNYLQVIDMMVSG